MKLAWWTCTKKNCDYRRKELDSPYLKGVTHRADNGDEHDMKLEKK